MYYTHKKYSLDKTRQNDLTAMFEKFDLADLGRISPKDARTIVTSVFGLTIEEAQEIIKKADPEERGSVRKEALFESIRLHLGAQDAEREMRIVFDTIKQLGIETAEDASRSDLSLAEVRLAAERLLEALDEQDLRDMFEIADPESTGKVNIQAFMSIMKKTAIW